MSVNANEPGWSSSRRRSPGSARRRDDATADRNEAPSTPRAHGSSTAQVRRSPGHQLLGEEGGRAGVVRVLDQAIQPVREPPRSSGDLEPVGCDCRATFVSEAYSRKVAAVVPDKKRVPPRERRKPGGTVEREVRDAAEARSGMSSSRSIRARLGGAPPPHRAPRSPRRDDRVGANGSRARHRVQGCLDPPACGPRTTSELIPCASRGSLAVSVQRSVPPRRWKVCICGRPEIQC